MRSIRPVAFWIANATGVIAFYLVGFMLLDVTEHGHIKWNELPFRVVTALVLAGMWVGFLHFRQRGLQRRDSN